MYIKNFIAIYLYLIYDFEKFTFYITSKSINFGNLKIADKNLFLIR